MQQVRYGGIVSISHWPQACSLIPLRPYYKQSSAYAVICEAVGTEAGQNWPLSAKKPDKSSYSSLSTEGRMG